MKQQYALLPFNFLRLGSKEILVNELGDLLVTPDGTVQKITDRTIDDAELYKTLAANFFISEKPIPDLLGIYASRLRAKKEFLDYRTALHIFVLTLRCNQNCTYCQASSRKQMAGGCTMSRSTMESAVRLMFRSPSPALTMEFQGGEPSLVPDIMEYGITLAEEINQTEQRHLTFVLCTNCRHLTDDLLSICKRHHVLISTSLDGPAFIHNQDRGREDSYEKTIAGIRKAREVLGEDSVSALMTTSELALDYPEEIIDEYVRDGFHDLFLRALNPYGLAAENKDWERYNERFVQFYKDAFEHILSINKKGYFIRENYATIILRKMLTPFTTGFVDLQSPAGTVNSVLVYNYDGYVYASDESRMLAEFNDYSFKLGSVHDRYEDIVYGRKVRDMGKVWANEALAGCSDCALRAYCGADPVRNHTTQGDMYGFRPTSMVCRKNRAIIEYLISLIAERADEVMPVFRSWFL